MGQCDIHYTPPIAMGNTQLFVLVLVAIAAVVAEPSFKPVTRVVHYHSEPIVHYLHSRHIHHDPHHHHALLHHSHHHHDHEDIIHHHDHHLHHDHDHLHDWH